MSSWMGWFEGGRRDHQKLTRDAVVDLRSSLLLLEKREDYMQKQIHEETRKAKANATSNKRLAMAALRNRKQKEQELDRMMGQRSTLETQVNALESANLKAETMLAMKKGSEALKKMHANLNVDKVDIIMDSIREQMDVTNEISNAISHPVGMATQVDEDELEAELEALEQEELDERLAGAECAPLGAPASPAGFTTTGRERAVENAEEDDLEAQLQQLQAELVM